MTSADNSSSKEDFTSIPVIDISNNNQTELAQQLWDAARNVGFFTIINHSIPPSQIDNLFHLSTQFFNLDLNVKHQYPFNVEKNSGYEYMTQKPPTTGVVDLKETFQVTAREGCMDNLWPTADNNEGKEKDEGDQELASFQNETMDFINNTHALACRILSLLESKACPHVAPGTLANSHQLWGKDGQCTLRLLHYPPTTITTSSSSSNDDDDTTSSETTRWRCGAHTDWGSLTLLFQRMGEDGLECQRRTTDGSESWVEVPPIEGGITVNIGDMLMRWSDKRLYSNSHRVRMPKSTSPTEAEAAAAPPKSRYSIAFFLQADKSALIENTTNEPITAGEYFAERINAHFADE